MNDPPATPSDSAVQRIAIDRAQRPVQARFHARIQRRTVGALLLTGDLALLAASVLALNDPALSGRLTAWRKAQSEAVAERPEGSA